MAKALPPLVVRVGGNQFVGCDPLLMFRGRAILRVLRHPDDGFVTMDLDIHSPEGELVGAVRYGNVVSEDRTAYDLTRDEKHWRLAERAKGREICRVDIRPDHVLDLHLALYLPEKVLLQANPDNLSIHPGEALGQRDNTYVAQAGIALGEPRNDAHVLLPLPPRRQKRFRG